LYVVALFLPFQMEFHLPQLYGASLTPLNVLGALLLLLILFKVLVSMRFLALPRFGWWALFVALAALAYALGPVTSPLQGAWAVFRLALLPPLFYLGATMSLNEAAVWRAVKLLAISSAVAGLIAVAQMASGGRLLSGYTTNFRYLGLLQPLPPEVVADYGGDMRWKLYLAGTNFYRGHGTFYTHNGFGAFISITACLTWGLLRGAQARRRWLWVLVLVLQTMGAIATMSRSAWAALIAGIGVAIFMEVLFSKKSSPLLIAVSITPLFALLLGVILAVVRSSRKVAERFTSLLSPQSAPEFQWRLLVWDATLKKIVRQPFLGSGTGDAFTVVDWAGKVTSYSAHNLFIGIAYELGVFPLMILLIFMVMGLRSAWFAFRQAPELPERMLALGLLSASVSFVVSGIGSALLSVENLAVLFWLMVALAVNLRHGVVQSCLSNTEVQREDTDGGVPTLATSH
jgi:O-antigen ligase